MFYNAKNGNIKIGNSDMDFVSFGKGDKSLIMIPGLSDGVTTVKGKAILMAMMYKCFAKSYKVYMISRKNHMEKGYSTRNMAADYKTVMDRLGMSKAEIIGFSQGGMIAQYIAIDYPELIGKLVLAVTLSKQNETVQKVINSWIKMVEASDFKRFTIDSMEKCYAEKSLKKYRPFYPLLSRISKPKNIDRFIIQANSCITHDAYDELDKIKCPTLVIGGDSDRVVGTGTSEEIAGKIENSKLIIHKELGHSAHEETKDFYPQVLEFLRS